MLAPTLFVLGRTLTRSKSFNLKKSALERTDPGVKPTLNGFSLRLVKTSSLTCQAPTADGLESLLEVTLPETKNPNSGSLLPEESLFCNNGPDKLNSARL